MEKKTNKRFLWIKITNDVYKIISSIGAPNEINKLKYERTKLTSSLIFQEESLLPESQII